MVQKLVRDFFKKSRTGVNPDEVVVLGAAVQAGVLSGRSGHPSAPRRDPLTLGIETLGGVMTPMIPRNTTIPTKKTEVSSRRPPMADHGRVVVTQGERQMARDNKILGRFHLDGIPPSPRGMPQIEVTFDIDANGIVNVSARDKGTNKERRSRSPAARGLTEAGFRRWSKTPRRTEADDKARKETIEARNHLDSAVYQAEKLLNENREKAAGGGAQ